MEPFQEIVRGQASGHRYETLSAWMGPPRQSEMAYTRSDTELFANPLRTFLWDYNPTTAECKDLWAMHEASFSSSFERGRLCTSTTVLLIAHPILLAKIICELLWTRQQKDEAEVPVVSVQNLFRRAPDPVQIRRIEETYRGLFRIARDFVERFAGYGEPVPGMDRFHLLRSEALSELRSWTDWQPLDDTYFLENIVKAAEALFDQRECDSTCLKVAVARSRACCAFLVSHLLMTRGLGEHL
jgi:hypothetical protein